MSPKTEMPLKEQDFLARLVKGMQEALWALDLELNFTYLAAAVEHLVGYRPQDLMHKSPKDFLPPESFRLVRRALARNLAEGPWSGRVKLELRLRHRSGSLLWTENTAWFLLDDQGRPRGILGVSRDISQSKQAQQELAQSHRRLSELKIILQNSRNKLQAVFDALDDPIFSLTAQGCIESLNLAAARAAGAEPRQLVGLGQAEFLARTSLAPPLRRAVAETWQASLEQDRPQRRLASAPGAEPIYLEITAHPVTGSQGRPSLGIVHLRDVSQFKRMENTIREYSQSLEQKVAERTAELSQAHDALMAEKELLSRANAELRRLEKLRQDLTAMVVHDMKGPLAEMMGNLDLMGYDTLTEMQQEALDLASLGADDLLRMIMNLLDIGRLEEGRLKIKPEAFTFGELAQQALAKFSTMLGFKELAASVSDGGEQELWGDRDLLGRVLQNLLTNAITHTPEKGRLRLAARSVQGGAEFSLADNGCGIPSRAHHLIFRKFTQASEGDAPRTSTGLGLTFCQLAVEAHGGRIWFESSEGQGTTFFVFLPGAPS